MMQYKEYNAEVYYTTTPVTVLDKSDMDFLVEKSKHNPRKRIRICSHPDSGDRLHEMLIIHEKDTYVRPHKHVNKSESFHVIEGRVDVVLLDDDGTIKDVIELGEYKSGLSFYYRLSIPLFHTLLIKSPVLVFHEITNGPFIKEETQFAEFAPDEKELEQVRSFYSKLQADAEKFKSQKGKK